LERQLLRWVPIDTAQDVPQLLPATYPPLRWLQLPNIYAISSAGSPEQFPQFLNKLDQGLAAGIKLFQWREPGWPGGPAQQDLHQALKTMLARCHAVGARVLINSVHPEAWWHEADGVHLRSQDAANLTNRPILDKGKRVGVSTHNLAELEHARTLDADFAVLGPVLPTASHPEHPGIGWDSFAQLNAQAGLPVFALGGQSAATLAHAQSVGGHGFAGIRGWIA
jgi:8-oxo-dGTP diphosphatase